MEDSLEAAVKEEDQLALALPSSHDDEGAGPHDFPGGKDPDRFHCPYPLCNRSFAELWRLKVHYRAPPDVRGSGKERGHGQELSFCPKCNRDLKPGKHHVGCSITHGKGLRPSKKSKKSCEGDGGGSKPKAPAKPKEPKAKGGAAGPLEQGFRMLQGGLPFDTGYASHAGPSAPPAYFICAPGTNGMSVWQGPPGGHGAVYPVLHSQQHSQHGGQTTHTQHAEQGRGLLMEHPSVSMMSGMGMSMGGGMSSASSMAMGAGMASASAPQGEGAAGGGGHAPGVPGIGMPSASSFADAASLPGIGMPSSSSFADVSGLPGIGMPSSNSFADAAKLLGGLFDEDGEEEGKGILTASVPSPPPLPEDWMDEPPPGEGPHGGSQLFDFSQFNTRMPVGMGTQAGNQLYGANKCFIGQDTRESRDLAEGNVVYEAQDDGDLMKLLFGVADEMPTMATTHLHKFPSSSGAVGWGAHSPSCVDAQPERDSWLGGEARPSHGSEARISHGAGAMSQAQAGPSDQQPVDGRPPGFAAHGGSASGQWANGNGNGGEGAASAHSGGAHQGKHEGSIAQPSTYSHGVLLDSRSPAAECPVAWSLG